jgi:hypothetical protein
MWFRRKNVDQLDAADALSDTDRILVAQVGSSDAKHALLTAIGAYFIGYFGTIASQDSDAVTITGGSITGTAIHGLAAPSAGGDAANKTYVDGIIAAQDAMVFKGVLSASGNPDYPAADRGWTYRISAAGKIGGASGTNVEIGDMIICLTDGTAAGTQAAVGANWGIIQTNIDGAVVGPSSVTDDLPAIFDGATGKLLKSKTYAAFKTLLALVKGDVGLGNTDNTSDANKPISTAQALAIAASRSVDLIEANGACEVWQMGTSVAVGASSTVYCGPDRWYLTTGTTQASVVSRQSGIVSGSRFAAKVLRNSGQTGTGVMKFAFPLITDEALRAQGQLLALSFFAKAGANWSPASGAITYNVYFGTGAAAKRGAGFTSETNPITGSINLTTTAAQVVSIASGAAGAAVTQGEVVFTWTPVGTAGADDSFTIDDVRLDLVPAGLTSFVPPQMHKSHGDYFLRCREVYRQSYVEGVAPGTVTQAGRIAYVAPAVGGESLPAYSYSPTMWATPIAIVYSPDTGASGNIRYASGSADVAGTLVTVTVDGHTSYSAVHTASAVYWYHYTADARL